MAAFTPTGPAGIAVTVIGGYLGAGKTTLVNHILATAEVRTAVLVNDFGDVDIDSSLIESADDDTISLANGCICCSLVDGLAAALDTVRALDPPPERLVIEASGVADPATVAAYGHGPGFVMDAVVVLTDAETVQARARDKYVGDTVLAQLRSADILVLNKVDLVTPEAAERTRSWLADHAPDAVLADASHAEVDPALLFGRVRSPEASPPVRGHGHDENHAHDHAHDDAADVFDQWTWQDDRPLTRDAIEATMAELPDGIMRAKGVLRLADDPDRPYVLQRVGRRWTLRPAPTVDPETPPAIVFIGHTGAIDAGWLDQHLSG